MHFLNYLHLSTILFFSLENQCVVLSNSRRTNFKDCPAISLPHGTVKLRGHMARFTCAPGYTLLGDRFSMCTKSRTWDNPNVKCIRANCKASKALPNLIVYPKIPQGVLNFFCMSGYQLHGPHTIFCDEGSWNSAPPTCLLNNQTRAALACDFESADLCGWSQDFNHDFDWRRENFKTQSWSLGTGPSHDHTTNADGYYMYIEATARQENDTARLISPVFPRSPHADVCFEFFYHMYGRSIGELRVFLKPVNDSWDFQHERAFFHRMGNHGDRWWRSFTRLGRPPQDYQIIIEGRRGKSYISDIAIDDVRIIENCAEMTETTPVVTEVDSTSTTEGVQQTSEVVLSIESCENRCNIAEDVNIVNLTIITCDCNDACWISNRCCPDYFDFCAETGTPAPEDEEEVAATTHVVEIQETTRYRYTTTSVAAIASTESDVVDLEANAAVPHQFDDYEEQLKRNVTFNEKVVIQPPPQVSSESESRGRVVAVVGAVLFGVVFVLVPVVVAGRKYLFCTHPLRRNASESQSDVRFLTTDEILDFSLQNDDYDDL